MGFNKKTTTAATVPAGFDATLLALADPTRRSILQRLSLGETCVTEIARPFDISLNAVSKHIRLLERAHLVTRRRAGREHLLSLNPAPLDAATLWMETQRTNWSARLEALDQLLHAENRAHANQKIDHSHRPSFS